jgi:hypothetical protein
MGPYVRSSSFLFLPLSPFLFVSFFLCLVVCLFGFGFLFIFLLRWGWLVGWGKVLSNQPKLRLTGSFGFAEKL